MNVRLKKIGLCFYFLLFAFTGWLFPSCQKEIQIDLPAHIPKIVVDGKIEPGVPPYIILTNNMTYFGPADINSVQNSFIHNASVTVSDGINTVGLTEYCSKSLPDSLLRLFAAFTGVDTLRLKIFNYCLYTSLNPVIFGQVGRSYALNIISDGKTITSTTPILQPLPLDSVWFKYEKLNAKGDTLGYIWAHATDPGSEYNAYRWLAKRNGKDFSFIAPSGAASDDKYYNGQSFDFSYSRGSVQNTKKEDDFNEEKGYYKKGDTVVVKFCTIDHIAYNFYRSLDIIVNNNGNPFASPSSVESNIFPRESALGNWCGYGVATHTVVCK
jgi:hypothetical protein